MAHFRIMKHIAVSVMALLSASACGDSSDGDKAKIAVRLVNSAEGNSNALMVGQASTSELLSLQYYILEISICEDLSTEGTAFSNPTNCLSIYENRDADYTSYDSDAARADTTNYIDLMDSASREKLSVNASYGSDDTHEYNWGIITWMQPVKVKASVSISDGVDTALLVTRDGADENGKYPSLVADTADEAELGIIELSNGGTWFKFQQPFSLTEADLSAQSPLVLDLVFNPDDIIKGWENSSRSGLMQDDDGYAIVVPIIDITPVAHTASSNAVKETYMMHTSDFDVRLELYYIDSDANKTIYGVDIKSVYTEATNNEVMNPMRISFITSNDDGTLNFEDWQHEAIISNLTRLETLNDTATATLACPEYLSFGDCSDSAEVDYELVSVTTIGE